MSSNKEKIIAAAENLEARGVNPTQVTVREALGGGSFATIGPVLKEWKESKKEDHALTEIKVPQTITERLEQLQGAVWQAAVDEAERRLTAEREALLLAQERAASDVAEQMESVAALESEAEKHLAQIETLETDLESRSTQMDHLRAELAEVKERANNDAHTAAEAMAREVTRREAAEARAERAELLHREAIEQGRSDLAALKNDHNADMAAAKRESAEAVKKAESLAQEQTRRAEKSETEAQQRSAGEQACQGRLEAASREIEQAQKLVAKLEDKADKAVQEAAELRGELRALREAQEGENGN
jgi:chromosome segregation ATPase